MSEPKLSGKVAVITGGARGLGRGYALRLAGLGADDAIIDRNLRAAEVHRGGQSDRRNLMRRIQATEKGIASAAGNANYRK
jgi:NAD(P)-dependent dehydrogenase (short-subunit alcohol dehydrogenase family)